MACKPFHRPLAGRGPAAKAAYARGAHFIVNNGAKLGYLVPCFLHSL